MRDAGIVDEDRHHAEGFFGGVEGGRHRFAVEHIGLDGDRLAARRLDLFLERLDPFRAARDQRHFRAIRRQHFGEAQAKPAR